MKFAALVLIWGSSFLLMKVGLESMQPMQIAGLRILSGAIVVLALLLTTGGALPTEARVWGHLLVCGFFLAAFPFAMFATSETRIASALAGIGNATTPIATVVATLAILPGERATGRRLAAIGIGFLGVVVIMQPWSLDGRPDLLGFGMALAGGASYGVGWTYNRRFLAGSDIGGLSQPAATLLCGLALMVPAEVLWAISTPGGLASLVAYSPNDSGPVWLPLLAVLALGVIGTGLAYMLQFDVVRAAGPVVGSTITYLIPIVSVLLGVLVLGERLTLGTLAGFLIVLGAAAVVNGVRLRRTPALAADSPVDDESVLGQGG
ncbi:MAG: EamA family transporter [Tetrasphaera sp.]